MAATTFADRVGSRALEIRPVAVLLFIVAAPFWLLGFAAALVWFLVKWVLAAVLVGWSDAKARRERVTDGAG